MNKVYAIIGPPASGKTAIVKQLKNQNIPVLISHTTRAPKKGEQQGEYYYFVSKEEFFKLNLVERVSYSGRLYGLTRDEVLNKVKANLVSVIDIDIDGFKQLKKLLGVRIESIYILIDKNTILERCISEGDQLEEIKQRVEYAEKAGEFNNWQIADHVVKNTGTLESTVRQILSIMGLGVPKVGE
jgi:guanylate kinase